ncbi:MAG: hypothetical protein WBV06_16375 [Acidimicrobiia bacterium]
MSATVVEVPGGSVEDVVVAVVVPEHAVTNKTAASAGHKIIRARFAISMSERY